MDVERLRNTNISQGIVDGERERCSVSKESGQI